MKLSLEEARKRATPGPLCLSEKRETCYELYGAGAIIGRLESSSSRDRDGDTIFRQRLEEAQANAALLVHCRNRFDEVVAALENLLEYSQTGRVKGIPREDDLVLDSVAAVLARAETVEMP